MLKLEDHVNNNRDLLHQMTCCFMDVYKTQDVFKFIPGHRAAILGIPHQIEEMKSAPKLARKRKERSLDELQNMLIAQLNRYPSKIGFDLPNGVISERNIVDLKWKKQADNSMTVDCGFSCPFCNKVTKVNFTNYWQSSNATKHLKSHVNEHLTRNSAS